MLKEKLFQSLAELESQLEGIKSATEQVSDVVSADKELVAKINEYAHVVNDQVQLLKQVFEEGILEITHYSKDTLNQVQADFNTKVDNHVKVVKGIGEEILYHVREVAKYESDQIVKSVSGKMESTVADLKSLGEAMADLSCAIQQDIKVSQKAAEDTVQAIYKLDGLPNYIMQIMTQTRQFFESKEEESIRYMENLSVSVKELKQDLKNQEAKVLELRKFNIALICLLAISILIAFGA